MTTNVIEEQRTPSSTASAVRARVVNEKVSLSEADFRLPEILTLSFAEFLCEAIERNAEFQDSRDRLEPPWQSVIFYFMRLIKCHPEMDGLSPREAFDRVHESLLAMAPDGECPWSSIVHEEICAEDAEAEFLDAWEKVRYLPGLDPIEQALLKAEEYPLVLAPEIARKRSKDYPKFVSLAGYLQIGRGDKNIMLPCDSLAAVLVVSSMTVSRYRKWAQEDGYIVPVKPHRRPKGGMRGEATEFRFNVAKFANLAAQAEPGTAASFDVMSSRTSAA